MKYLLVILLVLTSLIGYSPNLCEYKRETEISLFLAKLREKEVDKEVQKIKESEFSKELLKKYMGLVYPNSSKVIIKQFILETGWFKSQSFLLYNNICGMKFPRSRATIATGKAMGHAKYEHWTDSIDDYMLWKEYHISNGEDTSDYYKFLNSVGYAEASNYIKILKRINLNRLNIC